MGETQKVFAILTALICQHYIMHSFKYCNAKFAHRAYKQAYEYRSPSSVVALKETAIVKRLGKKRQRKKRFCRTE